MKRIILFLFLMVLLFSMGCVNDADVASHNLSQDADNFKIFRRVVFYNGITGDYILEVRGYCSIESDNYDKQLELTIKTGPSSYLKHFLGLSDNVTYFAEQLEPAQVSDDQYKVIFKPTSIIPTIEIR